MSDALFPVLPGLEWGFKRIPEHKTTIKESASGREYRARLMTYPRYTIRGSYEFLRQGGGHAELETLFGFFNQRGGDFESFRLNDPDDNTAVSQIIGVGDGSARTFQLVRAFGGCVEPVLAPVGTPTVVVGGVATTAFSVGDRGAVTFAAAPSAGAVITWSGTYHWRVRFATPSMEFEKFLHQLWRAKSCDFKTLKPYE